MIKPNVQEVQVFQFQLIIASPFFYLHRRKAFVSFIQNSSILMNLLYGK